MPGPARAAGRLLRAGIHIAAGWWTIRFDFPRLDAAQRRARVSSWSMGLLRILGVELEMHGALPDDGALLLVSNHISWLDIPAIHAAHHVRFVSKSAVRYWPVIGALSTGAGSLYIERERQRDALRVVHRMTEALAAGDRIAVFPEGTTGEGPVLLPFHANLLQAAISAGAPVVPMAIHYVHADDGSHSPAPRFVGDDTLVASLWRTLRSRPLVAVLRFGLPQTSIGRERRAWAGDLRLVVQALKDAPRATRPEHEAGAAAA
ncbi:MAG: 1-acyl-sn-glycerol-3-phosphate acyltransferase [Comamonadaceae bacterium]|nr:MAG: 1-acyl-sn-glycerol-3-phosphate acyltransferase [Comamonadaceae bacterium]